MAEKVISMKIWSAVIAKADGLEVNVAAECARAGVSRALFYKLLDRYNADGAAAPIERFLASPAATPADEPLDHPVFADKIRRTTTVTGSGNVHVDKLVINVGRRHAGNHAIIFFDDRNHATVFINNHVERHLKIDHTRRYQPSHNPRGRPPLQS